MPLSVYKQPRRPQHFDNKASNLSGLQNLSIERLKSQSEQRKKSSAKKKRK